MFRFVFRGFEFRLNCFGFRIEGLWAWDLLCRGLGFRVRAPSYLNSRLLDNVAIGYIEPRTHYLGNWSPRDKYYNFCFRFGPCAERSREPRRYCRDM